MISGKLYIHKNKINGKCYVGKTTMKPERRCGPNGSSYVTCTQFYNAIKKYGWENFEHIILPAIYNSIEELDIAEISLIAELDSYNNGYNCTLGGGGSIGYVVSDETKKKLSIASHKSQTGLKRSDEAKARMSAAQKGHAGNKGFKCSEETKARMSAAQKGHAMSDETKKKISDAKKRKNKERDGYIKV